jgi:hypothetical protein
MPSGTMNIDLIYGHNVGGLSGHWFTLGFAVRSE